jgi:glutathione-regulated potassium-efflux system ancillary protein KefF
MAEIVVIAAHPHLEHSRVTRALLQAMATLPPGRVDVRNLYRRYPDFLIDIDAEQAALAAARLVVWLHPIHWYSMPPLMKLWLDEVFAFGWAYGPGGDALRGKDLWLVSSTGGGEEAYRPNGYNRYFFDHFLHPYEQSAALTGMRWLPPLTLHGAHRLGAAALQAHADILVDHLGSYPQWPELDELDVEPDCAVPADARPVETD